MDGSIPGVPAVPPMRLADLGMLEADTLWPTLAPSTRSRRALGIAKHAVSCYLLCEHTLVQRDAPAHAPAPLAHQAGPPARDRHGAARHHSPGTLGTGRHRRQVEPDGSN